jgi:hypothetical protein
MTGESLDPFKVLGDLNPVDAEDLRGAAASARATRSLDRILSDSHRRRRRWRIGVVRPRRPLYLAVLIALVGAAAATAWALTQGATKQLTVGCYASADLQARTIVVPVGGTSAAATCRAVWERGDFGPPGSPRLQACVLPSGASAVFPSPDDQACQRLELAPLVPATSQSPAAIPLKSALVKAFLANGCMNEQQATAVVHAALRDRRLDNWDVRTNARFTETRPCASLGFDEERHLVLLVPMPSHP